MGIVISWCIEPELESNEQEDDIMQVHRKRNRPQVRELAKFGIALQKHFHWEDSRSRKECLGVAERASGRDCRLWASSPSGLTTERIVQQEADSMPYMSAASESQNQAGT